jgi:hypothetical protein
LSGVIARAFWGAKTAAFEVALTEAGAGAAVGARCAGAAKGAWSPGRTATSKVPSSWGSGLATKKGVGVRWTDPANKGTGIWIDAGNPANSQVTQQVDHVIVGHDGQVIGRSGQPIKGSVADTAAEAHIPLSEWQTWSNWFSP